MLATSSCYLIRKADSSLPLPHTFALSARCRSSKDFVVENKEDLKVEDEFALDDDDESDSESLNLPATLGPSTSNAEAPRGRLGSFFRVRRASSIAGSKDRKSRQGSTTSNISLAAVSASGTDRRTQIKDDPESLDKLFTMPQLLKSDHTLATRRMSRTSQIMNEEKSINPPHEVMIPEPSYSFKRDGIPGLDPVLQTPGTEITAFEIEEVPDHRATGKIASWRGGIILGTACFAQLVDNIWMTSINIAIPHIAEEFNLLDGSQSWLVSAYTLTFGGFLLLAGVLSDRLGRRVMFCGGMVWMVAFSIACGVARTGVQCIIFRALQGLGAAASVPSAIGVLSNFFVGNEKHRALSMFGAAGAVGFVVGLILGGILSGTLGWRYIFYINAPVIAVLAVSGWYSFPQEKPSASDKKPSLDLLGAGLGTSGIVLMTFALSQSEVSGWNKPIVVVTLVIGYGTSLFPSSRYLEVQTQNSYPSEYLSYLALHGLREKFRIRLCPRIYGSSLRLLDYGAPVSSCTAGETFAVDLSRGANQTEPDRWASVVYYISLIAQEVLFLTPLNTGLYMIPMGVCGFFTSIGTGRAVEKYEMKTLLIAGFLICVVGTFPVAFVNVGDLFWPIVFPMTMICVTGISIGYNVASIALVSAVPPVAKSLAGGLINTAFQIGSGFGLAITSLVYENVLKKQPSQSDPSSLMKGYQAALYTSCGLVGGSLLLTIFTVRQGQQTVSSGVMVH
ncbi:hypothetical protein D9757_001595 [Collybiopsis confluens]|uniref:Major facilitator superfamily (MFS) profile domain-containing protein n=1 Tax=Collybiopsis confluens TaxID=2823264 RepID=A0A8H5HZE0_9AGAR|nr:hypothetical protein D9757_001595 [Collybiopsis confluens]